MMEIERKFLVKTNDFKAEAFQNTRIVQGFLNTDPERTVRIRIDGERAFITIKGISNKAGLSRFEWEKKISVKEAEALLDLCEPGKIQKIRYLVKINTHTFEVDEFLGENKGLVIAEIELNEENEAFTKPAWLGREVTGDLRYYNSQLSKNPYINWKNN